MTEEPSAIAEAKGAARKSAPMLSLVDEALSEEETRQRLKERAQQLAAPPKQTIVTDDELTVVPFELNGEYFGLEPRYVQELLCRCEFSPVPQAPQFIIGVCGLHGIILPILDISTFLGLPKDDAPRRNALVVVGERAPEFGIVVDDVHHSRRIPRSALTRMVNPLRQGGGNYVIGVTEDALTVLDGSALLREPALYVAKPADTAG